MRYIFTAFFSFLLSSSFAEETFSLYQNQKRIKDHLLLKDYQGAMQEAEEALLRFPDCKELRVLKIRVLSASGRDLDAFRSWKKIAEDHGEIKEDLNLLEAIAWSVIENAKNSSQQVVNISSMIGASLTQDAKAVEILLENMRSSNAYIRMVAVRLSTKFGDKKLIDYLCQMMKKETVWYVRLELVQALAKFQIQEIKPVLKEVIASDRTSMEEKAIALESLLSLTDTVDENELLHLLKSNRAGLRYLASEVISYLKLEGYELSLLELLKDPNPNVKMMALNTFSTIGIKNHKVEVLSKLEELAQDPDSYVAMTACGVLMYYNKELAKAILTDFVFHENPAFRRFASSVIAQSGGEGERLGVLLLDSSSDPFVKANLSLGLLGHAKDKQKLCKSLAEFLQTYTNKIMLDKSRNPHYSILAPSEIRHTPEMIQYPALVDQHIRLHLLSQLSILRYPGSSKAVKSYLKAQTFGTTFSASSLLLQEGSEESAEAIKELLLDTDIKIKVQAALVLALFGSDEDSLQILQEAYPLVERDFKLHILEAIGHIGSKKSIPFLLEILDDPFNMMRIVAASAIIQCVYH